MNEHEKKMIAPIIVTVAVVLYYILYFGLLIFMIPGIFKVIFGIIPLIFAGLMIYVCVCFQAVGSVLWLMCFFLWWYHTILMTIAVQ